MPSCLQAYTFVVAASLSSTYPQVRLRRLLAAASVSTRMQLGITPSKIKLAENAVIHERQSTSQRRKR